MKNDLSDATKEQGYLSCLEPLPSGYPAAIPALTEMLTDSTFTDELRGEFAQLYAVYSEDRGLLRFHYHKLADLWNTLKSMKAERKEYTSSLADFPEIDSFITEDEINEVLSSGNSMAGGKDRIYSYFLESNSLTEKANFLKNEYGTSGRSHAISRSNHSSEDHSAKGMTLKKDNCTPVELSWIRVIERIDALIFVSIPVVVGARANKNISSASIILTTSMSATFTCSTRARYDISVSSVKLEMQNSNGTWSHVINLTAPSGETNSLSLSKTMSYSSSCTKGKTHRVSATFTASGESVTRTSVGKVYK